MREKAGQNEEEAEGEPEQVERRTGEKNVNK